MLRPCMPSSHITRDADGEVIVVESAQFTPAYEVLGFQAVNKQAGYSGAAVVIDGRHIEYILNEGCRRSTASSRHWMRGSTTR